MSEFRYEQFCPVARACEVLASRWTLLIVRDLLLGPQRFVDLKRALAGISGSVLAERLTQLEAHGVVERRELPPPAASTVYALTPLGEALRPAVVELLRWGVRLMARVQPGDHLEPRWVAMGLEATTRRGPTPARRIEVRIPDTHGPQVFRVVGGADGARITREPGPADAVLEADGKLVLLLAAGAGDLDALVEGGAVRAEGDRSALRDLPKLFTMSPAPDPQPGG